MRLTRCQRQPLVEKIHLFRRLLQQQRATCQQSPRVLMTNWRAIVAAVTATPKEKLPKYQTHLHIAALPDNVFEQFEKLIEEWGDIKGTKRGNEAKPCQLYAPAQGCGKN